jgi:hypothetical protein
MSKRDALPVDAFYAQFHHADEPHHHSKDHPTKEWHELYDDVPEAAQGKPVSYARGGAVEKHEKAKRHPALDIPGVHVVTAKAGEPKFDAE